MSQQQGTKSSPVGKIKTRNAIYPILIGLAVVGWMFYKDFDPQVFSSITFSWDTLFWVFVAFLCMFARDLGYIIRIRIFSGGELSWAQAFRVIMLWEFTSAITPSAVGGTSVAIIYIHKEGISVGRSSAMVMLTSFFDEFYFVIMFPLMVLAVGQTQLFNLSEVTDSLLTMSLMTIALIGYFFKLIWVIVLSYGLFINPRGLKWLLLRIFKIRPLRRWYRSVNQV
ncbi:MAG: flippase-like domain-containing protein, partial [Rikenellaceae bacterium]|nr:flippase-like domain-containing protein [Rikenellaceae bacterium]